MVVFEGTADAPPPRIGPRPLWLHLGTAALAWSGAALPAGSWLGAAASLEMQSQVLAMIEAAERRFARLLRGIHAYHAHPYSRCTGGPQVLWRSNGITLYDYGGAERPDAPPVLVIPSLINRHYILDLKPDHSLMRFLAAAGFRPFLVAWEDFGRAARFTTIDDCIAGKLEAALSVVRLVSKRPPVLLGYCLGGLLALALAARRERDVSGLVCMATPWDLSLIHI